METVLKQVFTFVTTLNKAHTDEVCYWDLRSIKNAFNWSKYTEEVYSKMKERSFRQEFEEKVNEMTSYLIPPSCLQLSFDDLGQASEMLFFTLIQNPHFPGKFAQDLFVAYNPNMERFDIDLLEKCSSLSSESTTLAISEETECLNKEEKDQQIHAQAKLMLNGMSTVVQGMSDVSKAYSYIKKLLERLQGLDKGMAVIVSIYIQSGLSYDEIKQNINQSIFQYFQHKGMNFPIHNIPDSLMLQAASLDYHFSEFIVDVLIYQAKSLVVNYPDKELYSWKQQNSESKTSMTYEDLCRYFSMLSKTNQILRDNIQKKLEHSSENSYVNVYRDVLKTF